MAAVFHSEIVAAAETYAIDPRIAEAVMVVESGRNPAAWNPEPKYRYLWDCRTWSPFRRLTPNEIASKMPPIDFTALEGDRDQEFWAQQASWGLMQLMGAVARELGYQDPWLTNLIRDPEANLDLGCKKIALLLEWSGGDVDRALAAYNGGAAGNVARPLRNQRYADKVLAAMAAL